MYLAIDHPFHAPVRTTDPAKTDRAAGVCFGGGQQAFAGASSANSGAGIQIEGWMALDPQAQILRQN
jgi:hypothetical protein